MDRGIEPIVKHLIKLNNHKMNISMPAIVVGVDKLKDGFIDVRPLVNHMNPITRDTVEYPTLGGVSVIFPNTKTSSFTFPVSQGDTVLLVFQSESIEDFISGNKNQHDPDFLVSGNMKNVVAMIGFTPYQDSPFNPINYTNEFNSEDLNIFHNKGTENEVNITLDKEGGVTIRSPKSVTVEAESVKVDSEHVEFTAGSIDANQATITTDGDMMIGGRSVKAFMESHTHIGNQGSPTSTPTGI